VENFCLLEVILMNTPPANKPSPMTNLPIINKLKALYWAEIHMREALQTCGQLLVLNSDSQELRQCIYTGIVISYSRSFGENNGLSAMDSKFCSFPYPQQKRLHDRLLHARNTIYAHRDLVNGGEYLSTDLQKEDFQSIEIHIAESGLFRWHVKRPGLREADLQDIAALCKFQIERINHASTKMLGHLCSEKSYPPGTYVLGDTFP
jgi:hypothetical protein